MTLFFKQEYILNISSLRTINKVGEPTDHSKKRRTRLRLQAACNKLIQSILLILAMDMEKRVRNLN